MRRRKSKNRNKGDYAPELSEKYGTEGIYVREISELDARKTPKQLDAPVFIHEMEGSAGSSKKSSAGNAYNASELYGGSPVELWDGKRVI